MIVLSGKQRYTEELHLLCKEQQAISTHHFDMNKPRIV